VGVDKYLTDLKVYAKEGISFMCFINLRWGNRICYGAPYFIWV